MKKLLILSLSGLLLVAGARVSQAQREEDPNGGHHDGHRIEVMLHDQESRISEGVKSGELTREESDRLRAKEDIIRTKMDDFRHKNGGFLTNNEQDNLIHSMEEISGEIYRAKHNAAVSR